MMIAIMLKFVAAQDGLLQQEVARCKKGRDKKGAGDAAAKACVCTFIGSSRHGLSSTGEGCGFILAQASVQDFVHPHLGSKLCSGQPVYACMMTLNACTYGVCVCVSH